jgi:hypothetical protein
MDLLRYLRGTQLPPKVEVRVVEVVSPRVVADSKEIQDSIRTLVYHPGFTHLLSKLKWQKSILEAKLREGFHSSLREVDVLQAGIYWAGWLEAELQREVNRLQKHTLLEPHKEEITAFEEIHSALQIVGAEV